MRTPRAEALTALPIASALRFPRAISVKTSSSIAVFSAADRWYAFRLSKMIAGLGSGTGIAVVLIGYILHGRGSFRWSLRSQVLFKEPSRVRCLARRDIFRSAGRHDFAAGVAALR